MEYSNNGCLHYKTNKGDKNAVHIKSVSMWISILNAAKLRNYEPIIASKMSDGTFPLIQYHNSCKTRFTLKRDIDNLTKEQENKKYKQSEKQEEILLIERQQEQGSNKYNICTRSKLPISPKGQRERGMLPHVCTFWQGKGVELQRCTHASHCIW